MSALEYEWTQIDRTEGETRQRKKNANPSDQSIDIFALIRRQIL